MERGPERQGDRGIMHHSSHRSMPSAENGAYPDRSNEHLDDRESVHSQEEKEKKKGLAGFFGTMLERNEREREKEREREREKVQEKDAQYELIRMIGYLTATSSEDWALVLEVCERASASEASAREAARALRREFK